MTARLARPGEPFAVVARRLNVVSRVIAAQEWIGEGAYDDAITLLLNLETELQRAIEESDDGTEWEPVAA